ncbi:MAG: hypothetical protein WBD31_09465 [Rubripirellula sp.]
MIPNNLPSYLTDLVRSELKPGETVIWAATPLARFMTVKSTGIFVFAIPWTLFSLFWIAGASGFQVPQFDGPGDLFPLFGVPFVLVGLGMLCYPILNYRNAFRTCYLLTNRRALTFEREWGRTIVRSFSPRQLTVVYRKQSSDGSGDLIFNAKRWKDSDGHSHSEEIGFLTIADVQEVEQKLKAMVDSHRRR